MYSVTVTGARVKTTILCVLLICSHQVWAGSGSSQAHTETVAISFKGGVHTTHLSSYQCICVYTHACVFKWVSVLTCVCVFMTEEGTSHLLIRQYPSDPGDNETPQTHLTHEPLPVWCQARCRHLGTGISSLGWCVCNDHALSFSLPSLRCQREAGDDPALLTEGERWK